MNKEKTKIILLQCTVCSLLPLLTLFLPYIKISIAIPLLGQTSAILTGSNLLRGMSDFQQLAGSELADYIEELGTGSSAIAIMILVFFLIPILLFIASAIWHGIVCIKEQKINKKMSILPFCAAILSAGGLIFINFVIKTGIDNVSSDRILIADIGSSLAGLVANSIEIKVSGQLGFWLLLFSGIVIGAEDIIFSIMKISEKQPDVVQDAIYRTQNSKEEKKQHHSITMGDTQDAFQNLVYTRGTGQQQSNHNSNRIKNVTQSEWSVGDPTLHSKIMSGMLLGIRGEYEGAQIQLKSGEFLYIGRSKECNLILSNVKASRKHCKITYDAKVDKYLLKNYSDNGVFLSTGQRLEKGKVWNVPHGTIFRVTKEDEFRLL